MVVKMAMQNGKDTCQTECRLPRAVRRLRLLLPTGSDAEDALLFLDLLLNSFF